MLVVAGSGGEQGGGNEALVRFLDQLESVQRICSAEDERRVAVWARELIPQLEAMPSRQKADDRLARIDYYRLVLDGVLDRTIMKLEEKVIQQLFLVAGDLELTVQSLESLLLFKSKKDFAVKLPLLEELFTNDFVIAAALVNGCLSEEDKETAELSTINRDLAKDRLISRLVNTPTVIANFAAGSKLNAPFLDNYARLLYRNILRAWLVVVKLNSDQSLQRFSYELLGKLLSKVIMNFGAKQSSTDLEGFLNIICLMAGHDEGAFREPVTELLAKINNSQAIEATLICLLNKCSNWRNVLLPQLLERSSDWQYVVTNSIPLRSYVRHEGFPRQLVHFVALSGQPIMENILMELLNCWAQSGQRPVEQHIFISRLIIFLILAIRRADRMDSQLNSLVKQRIYKGMTTHLQSLDMTMRFVGMRMAEAVLNILETVPEEDRLDFGAAKLNVDQEVARMFEGFDKESEETICATNEEDILNALEVTKAVKAETETISIEKVELPRKASKAFEPPLDSDDDEDLIPYDMSNDVSGTELVAPRYLLDLKAVLAQATDDKNAAEQFQAAVKVSAELIRNQLPLNDTRLGVDLLSILITLHNKVYNEHFSEERFEACVAIAEVVPKEAAEFLCEEFYTGPGRYAISHRILMLEVLSESARRLSAIPKQVPAETINANVAFKKLQVKDPQLERKKEIHKIIADRLAEKTRRFGNGPSAELSGGINRFHAVVGSFVFPLIHGFGRKQIVFQSLDHLKDDTSNVLLLSFLKTLCVLTLCSENAPTIRRIIQEELHLIVLLKFYAEEKIQMALLELIGCVVSVTPKQMIATDFLQSFLEIKAWLEDLVERNTFNPDMNKESRELAQKLLSFL